MTSLRTLLLLSCIHFLAWSAAAAKRPNIVLLFADDMGFSDIGCFGSEIETPNVDRLAANGLRFTHFYNTGRCCPSRAAILTGLYSHQADIGHMAGETGVKGYRDRLSFNAVTLAEVLGNAGYHTIMTGKWHLGWRDEGSPTARGFQHFYGTRGFIDSYFTIVPKTEIYLGEKMVLPVGDKPVNHLNPDQEWYTTDVFTDYAIHFIDQVRKKDDRPFFLYLAYNAPHFPLHAKSEDVKKYRGRYRDGWGKIRKQRHAKLVELGVVNKDWPLSPLDVPNWDTLTDRQRDDMDFKMALFAAIIDRLDQNIGRVVDHLKKIGELDNTLLVFVSDNGGTKETGLFGIKGDRNTVDSYEKWGRLGGWSSSYGQGWANLSNVPFRQYKRENHEGGVSAPFVVHWPAGIETGGAGDGGKGRLVHSPAHLIDLMPTFVEIAGAKYPEESKEHEIQPMEGESLVPHFSSSPNLPLSLSHRLLFWEHEGNRAVRDGEWKLVGSREGSWELYNIGADRTELNDLAGKEPKRFESLKSKWDDWAKRVGVLTPAEFESARRAYRESQRKRKVPTTMIRIDERKYKFDNHGVKKKAGVWTFDGRSHFELPRGGAPRMADKRMIRISGKFRFADNNGVIFAHGGDCAGIALYLKNGELILAQRADWKRRLVSTKPLDDDEHSFEAIRQFDGKMILIVDGIRFSSEPSDSFPTEPGDSIQIGADTIKPVGDYVVPNRFKGTLSDLKIEYGN
jgi:arylsulfatase A-like enzyme